MHARVAMAKYHGLGNDFLVWLPTRPDTGVDLDALARRLCDRHRGIGADGLLVGLPSGQDDLDAVMVLHNADGSRAEMSGNGIRCLAQALVRRSGTDAANLRLLTDAGVREVQVTGGSDGDAPPGEAGTVWASVDMGAVGPGEDPDPIPPSPRAPVLRLASLSLGNPHLVLQVAEPDGVDPALDGPRWEAGFANGCNVHFVAAERGDRLRMRTWERGAGVTDACGSGATAAAHAAHSWGLVGEHVTVAMPGGEVTVHLGPTAVLRGPSTWIADVTVALPADTGSTASVSAVGAAR